MTATKASVLIYGYDPKLLETRGWVLERNGFKVGIATHIEEATQIAETQPIDLLIICHTIPAEERRNIATVIQAVRPQVKVMLITTPSNPAPGGPWETVDALAGTEAMLAATRRAIETL
jgi:DNA-binding response OmpR family regulator